MTPPSDLIARFRDDQRALAGARPPFAVAVSGGPDSLALLLLAHAAFPGAVTAATVDHGLRPAAADEARFVADVCATLGVPHSTLAIEAGALRGDQASARDLRYARLATWADAQGISTIATAHHLDDQAETLLMRLARGAGTAGLSVIRPVRPLPHGVTLVRPLLGWRRAELAVIVARAGLTPVDDPSNRDPRYDRTRARALLASEPALDPVRLTRSATALQEAHAALEWVASEHWAHHAQLFDGPKIMLDPARLPRAILRLLLARALDAVEGVRIRRGADIERLLATLESGGVATLGRVKASGGVLWRFESIPPHRKSVPKS